MQSATTRAAYRKRKRPAHFQNASNPSDRQAKESENNIERVRKSLEEALIANQEVQQELEQNLQQIRTLQQVNRRKVASYFAQLSRIDQEEDERHLDLLLPCQTPPRNIAAFYQTIAPQEGKDDSAAKDNSSASHGTNNEEQMGDPRDEILTAFRLKAFRTDCSLSRKWTLEYFVDPLEMRPAVNEETKKRKILQEGLFHQNPYKDSHVVKRSSKSKTPKFDKEESMLILEMVHTSDGSGSNWLQIAQAVNRCKQDPSHQWTAFECFRHYKQHLNGRRAPKEKKATQDLEVDNTSMNADTDAPIDATMEALWEILFWYFVMQGPQFVWDINAAHALSHSPLVRQLAESINAHSPSAFFGTYRHLVQLVDRNPALNPSMVTESHWTIGPERKFVLLMKMYHDYIHRDSINGTDTDLSGNQQSGKRQTSDLIANQLSNVAMHFPHRTRRQITHKWQRSLDPAINRELFSAEEDKLLIQVIEQAIVSTTAQRTMPQIGCDQQAPPDIAEIARLHFPHRRPHQVYARWLALATPEQQVRLYESQLLSGGNVTMALIKEANGQETTDEMKVGWVG